MDRDFSMIQSHYGAREILDTCSSFDNSTKPHFDHNGDLCVTETLLMLTIFHSKGQDL